MLPIQVTFRDIPFSAAVEDHVRAKSQKLSRFYNRITSCRVVLELAQKRKHHGKLYNVRVDITVPGEEIVVTRKYDQNLYVAVRDAFQAISRQLEEHARKRHGRVKTHNGVNHGFIKRLIPEEGFGFIEGTDGNEYYFSLTNVCYPTFDQLLIGDAVEYFPQAFSDGWHAHKVIRHHHVEVPVS